MGLDALDFQRFFLGSLLSGLCGYSILWRLFTSRQTNPPVINISLFSVGSTLSWWSLLYALVLLGVLTQYNYGPFAQPCVPVLAIGAFVLIWKTIPATPAAHAKL